MQLCGLTQITSNLNAEYHPPTLISGIIYNAFGQVTFANLGNGLQESYKFDARGRLERMAAGLSCSDGACATTRYSLSGMQYAANGQITQAVDIVNGTWDYAYDDMNRLATAVKSGASFDYKYDRYGNRWQQNGPNQSTLTFSNGNNRVDGWCYDAVGNLLNDGACPAAGVAPRYQWDAEHRLVKSGGGAANGGADYVYDALGRRVRAVVGSSGRSFVYGLSGKVVAEYSDSGSWNISDIHVGGRHLATYVNGTTYFTHADWLGTARRRTNVSGNTAETCTSLPFGDGFSCTGSNISTFDFTGHERDDESGLYHTLFRKYAPASGRWLSADPLNGDIFNPQSLNRYAYVNNDPVNLVDHDGRCPVIVGGFGQSPDTAGGQALISLAKEVQANVAFPYASQGFFGSLGRLRGSNTDGDRTVRAALLASTEGFSVTSLTFSGGGPIFSRNAGLLGDTPLVTATYIQPGGGTLKRTANMANARVYRGSDLVERILGLLTNERGITQLRVPCGHDVNCVLGIPDVRAYIVAKLQESGPCGNPMIFTPGAQQALSIFGSGNGGSGNFFPVFGVGSEGNTFFQFWWPLGGIGGRAGDELLQP